SDESEALAANEQGRAGRITDAFSRSLKYMLGGGGAELMALATDPLFVGSLAVGIGVYMALWMAPEPVFSRVVAAATTLAILGTGLFTISSIRSLASAWMDLDAEASAATSDQELEAAAEK